MPTFGPKNKFFMMISIALYWTHCTIPAFSRRLWDSKNIFKTKNHDFGHICGNGRSKNGELKTPKISYFGENMENIIFEMFPGGGQNDVIWSGMGP